MFSINDGVFGFTGKPVKVLLSLFITSIGGLDEREMVRKIFGSIEHVMIAIKYFMNSDTQTLLYIESKQTRTEQSEFEAKTNVTCPSTGKCLWFVGKEVPSSAIAISWLLSTVSAIDTMVINLT